MAQPRFSAGARVSISPLWPRFRADGRLPSCARAAVFGWPVQYQVKSETEKFERIVDEIRLEASAMYNSRRGAPPAAARARTDRENAEI